MTKFTFDGRRFWDASCGAVWWKSAHDLRLWFVGKLTGEETFYAVQDDYGNLVRVS